jgi:signal transduction histidine kinase
MLGRILDRIDDERRLKWLLLLLFLALSIPTGAVLWQAYGQLKWESFHQHRSQAEAVTAQVNADIAETLMAAETRSFAEYSFLNITGDPDAGFLQRSPLSVFPVVQGLPGIIGYFQINANGSFSTPLLPDPSANAAALGISGLEYRERELLADRIRSTLADNHLMQDSDGVDSLETQEIFDELKEGEREEATSGMELRQQANAPAPRENRAAQYAKVQDLRLDDALQKKSASVEEEADRKVGELQRDEAGVEAPGRARRTEQSVLPETIAQKDDSEVMSQVPGDVRITTFESEVEPFEFALLDSGEFVLFRKVWRGGERLVQGMLIDQNGFVDGAIVSPFRNSGLSAVTDLAIGFADFVIRAENAEANPDYLSTASGMKGDLLYRARLTSPMDAMELIFSVSTLPAGPGATVLGWTSVLLLAVFGGGFFALYRLGLGQIRLARQQQDFVSSVSHELKTPLTSIRMYSEMLKEGWADEAKRLQYYHFIHDESERLTRLISNVLQLASITRNRPDFDLRPFTCAELLDRIQSKIASQVESAGFELVIEMQDDQANAMVEVDEDCMMQIMINLVDNAIKFSREASERRIVIGSGIGSDAMVRFRVRDFGPGIPREQIKKIFRLFYRPESELTRETVGTGIGLAIVHQLTVAMGGKVDVLNRDPGAEFGVAFPIIEN